MDFEVLRPGIDEARHPGERPRAFAVRAARDKARAVLVRRPHAIVLAADTIVVLGKRVFGKPAGVSDARRMLRTLSGRMHEVVTGVCVSRGDRGRARAFVTRVWMVALSEARIASYLATGEPLGKAGAYAIQGAGAALIDRISGSYSNVVGLPLRETLDMLRAVRTRRSSARGATGTGRTARRRAR